MDLHRVADIHVLAIHRADPGVDRSWVGLQGVEQQTLTGNSEGGSIQKT